MLRWLRKLLTREVLVKAPVVTCTYQVYREATDTWEAPQPAIVSTREYLIAGAKI